MTLSWEGIILHSPSAQETDRVGTPSTTVPPKHSGDLWLCLDWSLLPVMGCTPRQRLWSKEGHGVGGRGWLRTRKGIPELTVHALLKCIPAWEGQVRSFPSLFCCEDWNLSRATKVSGLLLRGVQRWEGQLSAGSVPCGWVCLGTATMEEQSYKTPGLICWMGPMANISCTLTLPGTV